MALFNNLFTRRCKPASPRHSRLRLHLEALEQRTVLSSASVVPLGQAIDGKTTFHLLQDAVNVATSRGDVVTIEPGAVADISPVTVNNSDITITGDPQAPLSGLPSYNLVLNASSVTLTHLNFGSITLISGFVNDAITHNAVNTINLTGGGASNLVIDQNSLTGSISLAGSASTPLSTVQITNNSISSGILAAMAPIINLQDTAQVNVSNNTIAGTGSGAQIAIQVTRGTGNRLANNTINLNGADLGTEGIVVQNPGLNPLTSVTVSNNSIVTGLGVGLYINAFNDSDMQAVVQGNDFHGNAIGVDYLGGNTAAIATDLGGGRSGSLGGNDFRSFTSQATATNAAILLQFVASSAVLPAQDNLFADPANAANAVFVLRTGTIDVSNTLSANQAFVQSLYNRLLGRSGTLAELNSWVAVLKADSKNGQAKVVTGILTSDESYSHIVNQYYLQYLGRAGDADGLRYWVNQLKGGAKLEDVQAAFLSSPEYLSEHTNDYLQSLFVNVLGRAPGAGDLSYWGGQLTSIGAAGVAKAFVTLREYRFDEVTALFTTFLHRGASSGDYSYWTGLFGNLQSVEVKLLSTAEFFQNG